MQVRLDLEDLAQPSVLRAIHAGAPGDYLGINQAFLDLFDLDRRPESLSAFLGVRPDGPDAADTQVAADRATVSYPIRFSGRVLVVEKSPIIRDDDVVAVLTVLTDQEGDRAGDVPLGPLTEASSEPITVLEITGASRRVISQNRASIDFDLFIEAAAAAGEFVETAEQARIDLFEMAVRCIEQQALTSEALSVADRNYSVRSEVISEPGVEPALVSQTMTDVSDRMRKEWLEQLVDVAGAGSVVAAAELAFEAVRRSLGFDRAALLRFDGELVGIFAAAHETADSHMHAEADFIAALGVPGVVRLPGPVAGAELLEMLDAVIGAALPVHSEGTTWGALVVGHSRSHTTDLSTLSLSMLESLGSTLGMVIEREGVSLRLRESNRRLEAYAHAAAHDLRSPLRRIRSFSQLLQARLEGEEIDRAQISDFAERIASGAERLDLLLGSMLEHATIDTLAVESHEYTDLQVVVSNICDGIFELSHEPRPTFVVEDLPEVRVPRSSSERVFRSLIDAIIKFSPPDRTVAIEISSQRFDGGVRVRLSDSGVGLSPLLADKLFELFAQLHEQGSGVSAVVTQLLATRNAKVWLEPERSRGATFIIEFPASAVRGESVG